MQIAAKEVLDGLKEFDSATIFNAVVEARGATQGGTELEGKGGIPTNFTGPEIRCLSPHLGTAMGYAFTSEMTTCVSLSLRTEIRSPRCVAIP